MSKSTRRRFLARASAAAAVVAAPSAAARAHNTGRPGPSGPGEPPDPRRPGPSGPGEQREQKKVHWENGKRPEKTPLFSGAVSYGNLLFIAGIGAHFEGDIKAHTKHVLDEIQKRLEAAGSSMEKVVKVNVYLNDLKDYAGMNEVFLGRFGPEPPVRTTIAAAGGVPGNSLVEIDCVAYI
jgi:2-iminobutanoate/2-iminopropanoate deaminase